METISTVFTILLQYLNAKCLIFSSITLVTSLTIYWLFFIPFKWIKYLDDVSYPQSITSEKIVRNNNKRDTINRLRKSRIQSSKEMLPPYPNGWYGILESSKLRAGEATFVSCLGEQLVVYRTQQQQVFILDAYCPHLGANMGIGGRVVDDCIECPFHQWSFRGSDGKCVNIPYSTSVPKGSMLKKWISQETNGFIFVWYHAEPKEIPWDLSIHLTALQKDFVYHGQNEFYVNCHIQEIPENGADIAHFDAIHNDCFIAGTSVPEKCTLSRCGSHHWKASWFPSDEYKHLAEVRLKHALEIFGKFYCFQMDVTGKQIGPSCVCLETSSTTFGKFQIFQIITPIEPLLQKVVHRFYGPRWLAPLMKIFICGESIMFERDMNIWNHKVFRRNPILTKEDAPIKQFRFWYSQFYTPNSKSFSEVANIGW